MLMQTVDANLALIAAILTGGLLGYWTRKWWNRHRGK